MNLKKIAALVGLSFLLLAPAHAVVLTIDWTGANGFVGNVDPGSPADLDSEVVYINTLLAQGASNGGVLLAGHTYTTSAINYNGTVSAVDALNYPDNPPTMGPSGYEYVLAKLGNTAFVWFVGGAAFDLSSNFGPGNGLSHWAAFNPTGTSVPDAGATVVLLGLGLLGMSFVARRRMVA